MIGIMTYDSFYTYCCINFNVFFNLCLPIFILTKGHKMPPKMHKNLFFSGGLRPPGPPTGALPLDPTGAWVALGPLP